MMLKENTAARNKSLRKANGKRIDSTKQALEKLLPFKPIANDRDYDTKLFATHLMRIFPHIVDFHDCFKLFRKHFNANLESFDDELMVADFILPYLSSYFRTPRLKPFVRKNFKLLQEYFRLSDLETKVLYAIHLFDNTTKYYDSNLDYFEFCVLISEVLQVSPTQVQKLLMADMPLRKLGFLESKYRDNGLELESFAKRIMNEPFSKKEMMKSLARIYPKSTLTREDFSYMKKDLDMLLHYCDNAKHASLYLYGLPGVGKNEIAALIAKELNKELWEIHNINVKGESDENRVEQFIRAQSLFDSKKHIVLLDECEGVFPSLRQLVFYEDKPCKNTLNKMLESVRVPSIFLSNSAAIDPAFLRRFDIVLEIKAPPKEKKQELIQKALQSQGINLDSIIIQQISESYLSQGVLLKACKVAKTLVKHKDSTQSIKNKKQTIATSFIQVLNEHLRLQGEKSISINTQKSLPYDMSLIHTSIDIKALSDRIKNIGMLHQSQGIRILAYGIAGSGKSEFAKALAKELNKPLRLKKASDLLSKWVGESEKNIAKAFDEADKDDAILVLDEADSFLQDRSVAYRNWEITQVNEMLTQIEHFQGIFIATTNFIENLDRASIRRFDIKVEFKPLDSSRLVKAFSLYAAYLDVSDCKQFLESTQGKRAIDSLKNICLGDFALIARSAKFEPILSSQKLLEKLQEESKLKESYANNKCVGFVR